MRIARLQRSRRQNIARATINLDLEQPTRRAARFHERRIPIDHFGRMEILPALPDQLSLDFVLRRAGVALAVVVTRMRFRVATLMRRHVGVAQIASMIAIHRRLRDRRLVAIARRRRRWPAIEIRLARIIIGRALPRLIAVS